ncbi:oligopeptide/dipeptide ABC transporter ATP-binding protein [Arthrobacter sp. alpha11c]
MSTTWVSMLITHDLNVAAEVADQIVVMYAGRVVESSPADALYKAPAHPYTEGLLASTPTAQDKGSMLKSIPGTPPSPANAPSGCAFNPRCPRAREICRVEEPPLVSISGGRTSACHFWEEVLLDASK